MSYCIELLSLLNLDLNKQYSRDYIFTNLKKKITSRGPSFKLNLWKIDKKFLHIIMEYNLVNTNTKFYDLFYLQDAIWRKHYKIGFTKKMIYQMIDSLLIERNEPHFIYDSTGNSVNELIL